MILYNMRHKGPFEYDKSILNVLQFSNEIKEVLNKEFDHNDESLEEFRSRVNDMYHFIVGDDNNIGLSQQLYYELIYYKEC